MRTHVGLLSTLVFAGCVLPPEAADAQRLAAKVAFFPDVSLRAEYRGSEAQLDAAIAGYNVTVLKAELAETAFGIYAASYFMRAGLSAWLCVALIPLCFLVRWPAAAGSAPAGAD